MPYVCLRDGHLLEYVEGKYCPEHGSPIFTNCPNCEAIWGVISADLDPYEEWGAKFCARCAHPGPWLPRHERIAWLKDRLHEQNLDQAESLKLREVLDKLAEMDPNDKGALVGWDHLKKAAPGLWELGKPILASVVGESLKAHLGLS